MNAPVVGLDARMIEHSGIGTYVRHLARGLALHRKCEVHFYGVPTLLADNLPGVSTKALHRYQSPIYSLREHVAFTLLPRQWDLWHCPHYNVPLQKKGKLVVTVHDLTHLVLQGKFFSALQGAYARFWFSWVRRHADAVIAVSHHTKKDLEKYAGIDPEKITVIYEGVSADFKRSSEGNLHPLKKKYELSDKFVLYVGNIKPHKNVGQLARVYRKLKQQKKIREDLVLVGRADNLYIAHDRDLSAASVDPSVRFLSDVSPRDLPGMYQMASAVVLPSWYEGFGLVVLEAMASGTPVIVSNRASLPEIAGGAAELFDPEDDSALEGALQRVTGHSRYRDVLKGKGLRRVQDFSWERMVNDTVGVYLGVLDSCTVGS